MAQEDGMITFKGVRAGINRGCCQTPFKKRADMHLLGRATYGNSETDQAKIGKKKSLADFN
ncbi:hypothetical protein, partial [Hallella mizrahii]|uniref:hypothetical protein n=1 Tax=Hallella mizrahii TaxID=2606637 RepID=UPI0019803772